MDISKTIFKSSMIYFVGQVLSKIISFLLLPLYTNYIATEAFAYYDLSISALSVVVPVVFMEIWTATLRFSLERKTDDEKKFVINNSMIIATISLVIYTVIFITAALIFKFDLPVWIYIYSFIWILQLFILSVTRVYGGNALYASSGVISVFFNAIITIAAVFLSNGNIISIYIGMSASMLIQVLIINRKYRIFSSFSLKDYDPVFCKTLIRFSIPLCFNSVMYWMLEGFNKFVINGVLGSGVTGVYAIGNRVSLILSLVISVFSLSWQETIFKLDMKGEKETVYNTGFNMIIKIVGAGLVMLLPVISILFPYVIGTDYASVRNLIPFLLLVIFVNAVVSLLASCFVAEKDTRGNMIAKGVSCTINVIVLFATIKLIGFYSSPLALFVANIGGIIVQITLLKKHVKIKPKYSNIVIFILMFLISMGIYVSANILINCVWMVLAGIFYCFYIKDFILKMTSLIFGNLLSRLKR